MLNIAGTIILYNPNIEEIIANVQSYISQLDKLIVVDNSDNTAKNIEEILNNTFNNKIIYINNNHNLGIATALNIACDRAIELGYDWILTMDQDSRFINFDDYIQCLSDLYNQDDLAIIGANTQWNPVMTLQEKASCYYEEKFLLITSANFLNLKLFNTIGRFEDKLFIDMVDHDYCMKANSLNYKIYYFKNIMVQHSLGNLFQRKNIFTKKIRKKIEHSPQRVYYITRNFLYTWKKYSEQFPKEFNLLKTLNILFIHEVTKILIYEDQKFKKIYAKFLGLLHFLIGRYGKYTL
jgi:rhamnosyltransferase